MNNNLLLKMKAYFTRKLLDWNAKHNRREMPWKGEKDPYKIWLSEIILQQTRVEQGWAYYLKFITQFPHVADLANAPEDKVFKLWEGLGYYSRCRNLIASAKIIHTQYKGVFPDNYEAILQLKGVGTYTAAAIASFAYNQPYAVVDGNVLRVLSRYFGIETPIDSAKGKTVYASLATELLPPKKAGLYNQALMDFGATVCKPQSPLCEECLLQKHCVAFIQNKTAILPVKEKKLSKKNRWFYYFVVQYKNEVLIRQRMSKDIWQHLYEFILIESAKKLTEAALYQHPDIKVYLKKGTATSVSKEYVQQLTHQTIHGQFIEIRLRSRVTAPESFTAVTLEQLNTLAFPKLITTFLQEKNVNLS